MRAYRIHQPGGPDSLRREDLPEPKAGPGQVVVRVRAASLNYRDLLVIKGAYSRNLPLPMVPLSDGAGEVAEVGPGVARFKAGDRVAGCFFSDWGDGPLTDSAAKSARGGAVDGMLAELVVSPEGGLVRVPDHLTDEEASTLPCAGLTAWHALMEGGGLKAGQSVLVQGTGGVSLFALQFARLAGARVIATSSSDAKLSRARELGASDGINYKTTADWDVAARNLTDGLGLDHVVEVGGAGTLPRSIKAVRLGGHIALIGVLTGGGEFDPRPLLMKNIRLQGIYVGSRAMFEAMNRAIALHGLKPVVDRVFPFDQAIDAYKHLESGNHFGKVVIAVSG
jgi:NADPH:quinone reductase-like Zn-dependent oxidoreductase